LPRGVGIDAVKMFDEEISGFVHFFRHTIHHGAASYLRHFYLLNDEFRFHEGDVIEPNKPFMDCYATVSAVNVKKYFLVNQSLIETRGLPKKISFAFMTSDQQIMFRIFMKRWADATKGRDGFWVKKAPGSAEDEAIEIIDDDDDDDDNDDGGDGSGGADRKEKENSVGKNKRFKYDDESKN
jgi:hypothetical protein